MRLLKEPLVHFLVLGALLFGVAALRDSGTPASDNDIIVTTGQIGHLTAGFERTWRRTPTDPELSTLIEAHVQEEVYYREALNLGLDQGDRVIRQRLNQKVRFLMEGLADDLAPTDSTLSAFMDAHAEDYSVPPRAAFRQLYFNPDRHGDALREEALSVLVALAGKNVTEAEASLGDPFLMPSQVELSTSAQISRMFGAMFSEQVLQLQVGKWSGPVASEYGLHLVYVQEKKSGRPLGINEARPKLLVDWQQFQRQELLDQAYERLRSRYTVTIEQQPSGAPEEQVLLEAAP